MTKKFSLQAQIQEAEREIKMRREVYPRQSYPNRVWRHRGEAQIALEIMENIKSTLEWLAENETELRAYAASKKGTAASAVDS